MDKSFMEIQDFVSFAFRPLIFVKHLSQCFTLHFSTLIYRSIE